MEPPHEPHLSPDMAWCECWANSGTLPSCFSLELPTLAPLLYIYIALGSKRMRKYFLSLQSPLSHSVHTLSCFPKPLASSGEELTSGSVQSFLLHLITAVLNLWVTVPLELHIEYLAYQIFTSQVITVAQLPLQSRREIMLRLRVTTAQGAVLKDLSIGKIENHCFSRMCCTLRSKHCVIVD